MILQKGRGATARYIDRYIDRGVVVDIMLNKFAEVRMKDWL